MSTQIIELLIILYAHTSKLENKYALHYHEKNQLQFHIHQCLEMHQGTAQSPGYIFSQ